MVTSRDRLIFLGKPVREARHIGVLDVLKSENLTQEEGPLALQLGSLDGGFGATFGLECNGHSEERYIRAVTMSNAGSALLLLDLHPSEQKSGRLHQ
jgi:hypothetical protein